MMRKRSSLSLALLLCLLAHLFLSLPALAGTGCGTNWMGDTTGDTDFYVSKNQNKGVAGSMDTESSASSKAAVTLGSTASSSKNASIDSFSPDKASSQSAGTSIVWTVQASNPENQKMLYDFLLSGPSTGGQVVDQTGWTETSSWTWSTTNDDAGENHIAVMVKRSGSVEYEDLQESTYIINAVSGAKANASAATSSGSASSGGSIAMPTSELDVTPSTASATATTSGSEASSSANVEASSTSSDESTDTASSSSTDSIQSKTSKSLSDKPRVAPDERETTVTKSEINMDMPDPTPKSTTESSSLSADAQPVQAEQEAAASEAAVMDVEGKWTVKLDRSGQTLDLYLIQTDASVMGSGELNDKEGALSVSAKGSVSDNSLSLEVWTVISEFGNKIDKSINLELVKVDRVVSGSYELYTGEDMTEKGNATASRYSS